MTPHSQSSGIRSNSDWLDSLETGSPGFDSAIFDLRTLLMKGLTRSFGNHRKLSYENLEDFCQDALMKILSAKERFSGKSQFTTWAMKVAVNLVLSEIRKKSWDNVSLDVMDDSEPFLDIRRGSGFFSTTEQKVLRKDMADTCNMLIRKFLSKRQRRALIYSMKYGMPLDEVARRTDSTRNSVYKLLHDARKKLKQEMENLGITRQDICDLEEEVQ